MTRTMRDALRDYLARCVRTGECLIGPKGPDVYGEVTWGMKRLSAHRAVVLDRDGALPAGFVVRHTCDIKGCAETTHLLAGTQSQNVVDEYTRDRRTTGWRAGDTHPHAVLTVDQVCNLRRRARGGASLGQLAATSGFPYSAVRSAVRGESWGHVTTEPPVPGRTNKVANSAKYTLSRPAESRRALALSRRGLSLQEIADQMGVPRHTAFRLRKAGLHLQELA